MRLGTIPIEILTILRLKNTFAAVKSPWAVRFIVSLNVAHFDLMQCYSTDVAVIPTFKFLFGVVLCWFRVSVTNFKMDMEN